MRYSKNEKMLSPDENRKLKSFRICIVGCGGLGGNILEQLGRLGIGTITAVDGDVFDETNLNRQLLSHEKNLGKSKAAEAKARMCFVNSDMEVIAVAERLTTENAREILRDHDLIMDALDNVKTRFVVQEVAKELNIPLVHGAISGWYGQVSTIFPGDETLHKIYPEMDQEPAGALGNPSFTPALIASYQVAEALKVLLKLGSILRHQIMFIDTLENKVDFLYFSK